MYEDCLTDSVSTNFAISGSAHSVSYKETIEWNLPSKEIGRAPSGECYWVTGTNNGRPNYYDALGRISDQSGVVYRSSTSSYTKSRGEGKGKRW